jgi:hypothetical protein
LVELHILMIIHWMHLIQYHIDKHNHQVFFVQLKL